MRLLTLLTILIAIVLFNLKDKNIKKDLKSDVLLITKEENGFLYLSLKCKYHLEGNENYQFFINSDKNSKNGFYGSDFLVENGRLFSYDGMQNSWKWKFETKLDETKSTQPSTIIPIKKIVSIHQNEISIKATINNKEWQVRRSVIKKIKLQQQSLALE